MGGEFLKIKLVNIFGGCSIRDQIDACREGVHVAIGTPGRMYDFISRARLPLESLQTCVLHNLDEVLARGFTDQIYDIMKVLPGPPAHIQVCIHTRSPHSPEIRNVVDKFTRDAVTVCSRGPRLTMSGVEHFYICVEKEEWRLDTLQDLVETLAVRQTVIYCNTRRKVEYVYSKMTELELRLRVAQIHHDLDQSERDLAMRQFRSGEAMYLVSNIPIQSSAPVVVNFDIPQAAETYHDHAALNQNQLQRRVLLNFVTNDDVRRLKDHERDYNLRIDEMPMDIDDLI